MLVESFQSGVAALPPLWDPSISGPAPQHNMPVAVMLLIGFVFLTCAMTKGIFTRAIPLIRLVRSGCEARGTVVDRAPPKNVRTQVTVPVVEFITSAGERIRFLDVCAPKRPEQPGESVTVHYNPDNPHGLASIVTRSEARRVFRNIILLELLFLSLTIGVLLDVVGVYRVDWL
ncbi:MAG TPA: DUF3592 domain-containing protein [Pseudonocardiaceae bacterium]